MTDKGRIFRGDRLKAIRERRGLTQAELAERIKIGQNQIYRYENHYSEPTLPIVARLADELDVSVDYLLGLTDDRKGKLSELTKDEAELLVAYRDRDFRRLMQVASELPPEEVEH